MKEKSIYLVDEVSKYLRIHSNTIRRLAREGKILAFKVGGLWRFDAKAIDVWKEDGGV